MWSKWSHAMIGIFIAATVAGCATTVEEPVLIGRNSYMIVVSHTALGSGLTSHALLIQQAIIKARQFCASKGRQFQVDSISGSGAAGFGSIDNTINFMCPRKAKSVHLRQSPNTVIEVR